MCTCLDLLIKDIVMPTLKLYILTEFDHLLVLLKWNFMCLSCKYKGHHFIIDSHSLTQIL